MAFLKAMGISEDPRAINVLLHEFSLEASANPINLTKNDSRSIFRNL
jgi:hypothetical protein